MYNAVPHYSSPFDTNPFVAGTQTGFGGMGMGYGMGYGMGGMGYGGYGCGGMGYGMGYGGFGGYY
jgi:hypothetical protein